MEPTREQIKEQDDGWWCHAWRHCFSRIYEILHLHIFSSNWAPSWADLAGKAHHRSLFSFLGKSFRDVRFKGRSSVHTLFFFGKKKQRLRFHVVIYTYYITLTLCTYIYVGALICVVVSMFHPAHAFGITSFALKGMWRAYAIIHATS
jgi:hypothetical protein